MLRDKKKGITAMNDILAPRFEKENGGQVKWTTQHDGIRFLGSPLASLINCTLMRPLQCRLTIKPQKGTWNGAPFFGKFPNTVDVMFKNETKCVIASQKKGNKQSNIRKILNLFGRPKVHEIWYNVGFLHPPFVAIVTRGSCLEGLNAGSVHKSDRGDLNNVVGIGERPYTWIGY